MAKDTDAQMPPDLAAEIAALRQEMEAVAATLKRIGRAGFADAGRVAGEGLNEGGEALGGAESRILREIEARPWRALGIAALGGLVLGLILRR